MSGRPTLAGLAGDLAAGRSTGRALLETCLEAIDREDGEGGRILVSVGREGARAQADAMDLLRGRSTVALGAGRGPDRGRLAARA